MNSETLATDSSQSHQSGQPRRALVSRVKSILRPIGQLTPNIAQRTVDVAKADETSPGHVHTSDNVTSPTTPQTREIEYVNSMSNFDWTAAFALPPTYGASGVQTSSHSATPRKALRSLLRTQKYDQDRTLAAQIALGKNARALGGTPCTEVGHGWRKYIHFKGSVYYHHPELQVVTRDNVEDDDEREAVENLLDEVWYALEEDGTAEHIPSDYEIIVESALSEADVTTVILCHSTSQVFKCGASTSGLEVETNLYAYWHHVEEYPMHLGFLPPTAETDFLNAVTYGANVGIFEAKDSLFPYTDKQLEQIMGMWRHQCSIVKTSALARRSFNWHIGRTLAQVELTRLGNPRRGYRGITQSAFDMNREPQKFQSTWQLQASQYLLMIVLLGANKMYFGRLRKLRRGKGAYLLDFREVIQQFLAEWTDSNLLATVFVGANVAFQQVPNVNGLQRTASLASSLFSLLSVAAGVHHVWRHRTKVNADINDAVKYLNHAGDWETVTQEAPENDLLTISAFLAVPFSALIWSMVSFTVALAALCIQNTSAQGLVLIAVVLGAFGLSSLAMLLFFRHIWKSSHDAESTAIDEVTKRQPSARMVSLQRMQRLFMENILGKRQRKKRDEECV